uniref:E3 SUMO-protein ligase RanBP2-like n=1 Tax=Gouania willdenowi TaxID=441366 RepID=A0A8C5DVE8_GOUWI
MKSSSSQQPSAGFTIPFGDGSPFQFGQNKVESSPASFKFEAPQSAVSSSTSSGFSFSFPNTSSGFKFGIQEPAKESKPTENLMTSGSFEPIIQMPEKVDLVTGEEDEQVLYSQRVKLFRFDADTSQWKERGVGILKLLKNISNGRLRVLMRREQVFKVCANHLITTTMNLKSLAGSDKAWMWLANDFSDGDGNLEQLAAKFKNTELAEEFKQKFEECQRETEPGCTDCLKKTTVKLMLHVLCVVKPSSSTVGQPASLP